MVDDLRAAHVEDELLPALGPWPAGHADRPVRVGREEVAARAHHLGLDPQPEEHAERLDPPGDAGDPVRQLAQVDGPVAERGRVVVALAEPAVVEHEQLDAELVGDPGDLDELVLGELEVRPLPVVDEHRPRPVAPDAAGEPLAVQPVVGVAQVAEAVGRVDEDRLGRAELGARLERPGERLGVDADPQPEPAERVALGLGQEVARVDQAEADRLAGAPRSWPGGAGGGTGCARRRSRRAGCRRTTRPGASRRSTTWRSRAQVPLSWTSSQSRSARSSDGAHAPSAGRGARTRVPDRHAPRDRRRVAEDRVGAAHLGPARLVEQRDLERLRLLVRLDVGRRQAAIGGLPGRMRWPR